MKRSASLILGLLTLVPPVASSAGSQIPVAVSPGAGSGFQQVAQGCTTFSWAGVEGAMGYTLAVYEVTEDGQLERPIIRHAFPEGALSWTVPAGHCLSRGMTYAWTVGATGKTGTARWSEPVVFKVAPGATETELKEALAVVRSYLATQNTSAGSEVELEVDAGPELPPTSASDVSSECTFDMKIKPLFSVTHKTSERR